MTTPPFERPVCVTGATGYVAGHVVRELLERGATVHGTTRDPSKESKVGHLRRLADEHPGTLELFAADLLEPGSFTEAVAGCGVVIHTASPFVLNHDDPVGSVIEPAVEGTRNVLGAVEDTETVQRVVLTSSAAACHSDAREVVARGGVLDESHWNEVSTPTYRAYSYSKALAERTAWELAEAQERWRLVTINPGFVMGPSLTPRRDSTSVDTLLRLIDGRLRTGMWESWLPWVDVRDVATAHVEAALRPDAEGRHLVVAETTGFWTVIGLLDEEFGDQVTLPAWRVPKPLAYLLGPLNGFTLRFVHRDVGLPFDTDNRRSQERLGIRYRPLRTTIREHVEQLMDDGLYAP